MKQGETNFQNVMSIICFIYAGISLILFFVFLVVVIKGGNVLYINRLLSSKFPQAGMISTSILKFMATVVMSVSFFSFVVSLLSGIGLQKKSHKEVVKEVKEEENNKVSEDLLTDDEKKIVNILKDNNKSMTQSDLTKESEMSKVKIHRVLKRLEGKKVVSKYSFGMTNRIRLERDLK
ncbi:hypothetical protein CL616_01315 [archaeon]|nr:hypothetical protein [archaeon]|tara:strand:- start:277 stop:810 length:534 start_codon:yes stop_codon:yes gene_type:complete